MRESLVSFWTSLSRTARRFVGKQNRHFANGTKWMGVPDFKSPEWIAHAKRHLDSIRQLTLGGDAVGRHRELWHDPEMLRYYLYSFTLEGRWTLG
jgi:hypothetical protein